MNSIKCQVPSCKSSFKDVYNLVDHLREVHNSTFPEGLFHEFDLKKCPACCKIFLGKIGLTKHQKTCRNRPLQSDSIQECSSNSQAEDTLHLSSSPSVSTQNLNAASPNEEGPMPDIASPNNLHNINMELLEHASLAMRSVYGCEDSFRTIVIDLIQNIANGPRHLSEQATILLISLPRLLTCKRHGRDSRRSQRALKQRIEKVLASPNIITGLMDLMQHLHSNPNDIINARPRHPYRHRGNHVSDELIDFMGKLVSEGRSGKALSIFEDALLEDNELPKEGLEDMIKNLHPACSHRDYLNHENIATVPIEIDAKDIEIVMSNLPMLSSGGLSGWTYELLKVVCDKPEGVESVVVLFNMMLRNIAPLNNVWNSINLVPLKKSDSSIRPIAIPDAWIRLLGRVVVHKIETEVVNLVSPYQFGVGIKSGAEIIINILNLAKENNFTITSIDFVNAYNTLGRKFIFDELKTSFPGLCKFFLWSYGGSKRVPLFLKTGINVGFSETGIRQGDPLGPIYFCLGIHSLLKNMKQQYPDINVYAYLDDIHIMSDPVTSFQAFEWLHMASQEYGLHISATKSKIWHPFLNLNEFTSSLIHKPTIVTDGLKVLGSYIGHNQFISNNLSKQLDEKVQVLSALSYCDVRVAFPILRACINARPVYLMQTTRPNLTLLPAVRFDSKVDACLAMLCGVDHEKFDVISRLTRHLPTVNGGLGVRRMELLREPAFLSSFSRCQDWLQLHSSDLYQRLARNNDYMDQYNTIKRRFDNKILNCPDDIDFETDNHYQMANLMKLVDHDTSMDLEHHLPIPLMAWRQGIACKGTSSWLFDACAHRKGILSLSPEDYAINMCLRLMLPLTAMEDGFARQCKCGWEHDLDYHDTAQHAMSCKATTLRTSRHDEIRDALGHLLRDLRLPVDKEVEIANGKRIDIRTEVQGVRCYIDVSVVHPGSTKYLGPVPELNKAIKMVEDRKRNKYSPLMNDGAIFRPFVMETTGRISEEATTLVDTWTKMDGPLARPDRTRARIRKFFYKHVSAILARYNAAMVKSYWANSFLVRSRYDF